jgi:hypothetical protein
MKAIVAILVILFYNSQPLKYESKLAPDYMQGIRYLKKNRATFTRILKDDTEKRAVIISVVFPEIVRYSIVRDLLETKSLEIGYVSRGSEFIDFSVGRFQMKPSFVESIENSLRTSKILSDKYPDIISYNDNDKKARRKERIKRLKSLNWQLRYMMAFYDIVSQKHPFLEEKPLHYCIRFFAVAYNHGFYAEKNELENWMDQKTYPYGPGVKGEQYAYSKVSEYFFTNHYPKLFNHH